MATISIVDTNATLCCTWFKTKVDMFLYLFEKLILKGLATLNL